MKYMLLIRRRHARPTAARWRWCTTTRSGAWSSDGSVSSFADVVPSRVARRAGYGTIIERAVATFITRRLESLIGWKSWWR